MNYILSLIEGNTFYFQWEVDLIVWLQQVSGSFVDMLMSFFSMFGEELIMVAVLGFIYWGLDKKAGEYIGLNLIAGCVVNPLFKNIANRRRPYFDSPQIECRKLIDSSADKFDVVAQGYSFPSGHSSGSASLYPALAVQWRKKWLLIVAIAIPFLVGISRVFLGVHYPTDVLAGWALGVGLVFLNYFLLKVVKNKYWIYLGYVVVGAAGMFYCKTNDYFTSYGMLLGFTAGVFFDEKVTKFENTKVWWRMILRVAVGAGLYLGLNALIKLPMGWIMGEEWLETASAGNFAFRTIRYAVIIFLVIGVYPMLFKVFDKFLAYLKAKKAPVTAEVESIPEEKPSGEVETKTIETEPDESEK